MNYYEIILEELQNRVDSGELTLEQAEEVNTLAYDKYVSEGALKRFFSRSEKNSKANTVLNAWALGTNLPSIETAEKNIKKYETKETIDPDTSMNINVIKSFAVLDYPQSRFIKFVKKIDNNKTPKWMLAGEYKTTQVDDTFDKAMDFWDKKQMKVICPDGFGNYLLYSINDGKFYDYFHEQDYGENYKNWLSSGITYKDFMKHIRESELNS